MSSNGESLLDKLFNPTFKIESSTVEDLVYPCRDLPNETLLWVTTRIVASTQASIVEGRRKIINSMVEDLNNGTISTDTEKIEALQQIMPIILGLVMESNELIHRIMKDCITDVELTEEHIKLIPAVDAVTIVEKLVTRIDVELLTRKIGSVFKHAMSAMGTQETTESKAGVKNEQTPKLETIS